MNPDVMALSLYPDMTNDELEESIHHMWGIVNKVQRGFCLSIGGFDDDPRDLWEIPEAIAFLKKLVAMGFLALLVPATTTPGAARFYAGCKNAPDDLKLPGFGGLEIWMCATGLLRRGRKEITAEQFEDFKKELDKSRAVVVETLKKPCPNTGIEKRSFSARIPDGQTRHQGYNKDYAPKWYRNRRK